MSVDFQRLRSLKAKQENRLKNLRKQSEKYIHESDMVKAGIIQKMHYCLAEIDNINALLSKDETHKRTPIRKI